MYCDVFLALLIIGPLLDRPQPRAASPIKENIKDVDIIQEMIIIQKFEYIILGAGLENMTIHIHQKSELNSMNFSRDFINGENANIPRRNPTTTTIFVCFFLCIGIGEITRTRLLHMYSVILLFEHGHMLCTSYLQCRCTLFYIGCMLAQDTFFIIKSPD